MRVIFPIDRKVLIIRIGVAGILFLMYLAGQPSTGVFAESSNGLIEGRIINGTAGGPNPVDYEVILQTYANGENSGEAIIAYTDGNGEFKFEDLDASGDYEYVVLINYQHADYYSDLFVFDDGESTHKVELQVFEATEINDSLMIQMAGTVISPQGDMIVVTEYAVVENAGDKTYIGTLIDESDEQRKTLQFPLPTDVIELQAEAGFMETYTLMEKDSIIDTLPIYPGLTEYKYYYSVPVTSDSYAFVKSMDLPVDTMIVEIADQGNEVLCDGLVQETSEERDGQQFIIFQGEQIKANASAKITIYGLLSDSKGNNTLLIWIPPLAIVLCLLTYLFIKYRKSLIRIRSSEG